MFIEYKMINNIDQMRYRAALIAVPKDVLIIHLD